MSLRLLLGILGPGLSDFSNKSALEEADTPGKITGEDYENIIDFQTPAKFHIGMLTVSLITGLGFGIFTAYKTWIEKSIFLDYVRNLIIALVCRTFFSIIFDGAILLGVSKSNLLHFVSQTTPLNVGGGNALLAFEQICLNLVLAFWLTFTIYLHARVQRNFNSEPSLRLYQYGVPGIAVFFAFIWIFTLQDQDPSAVWWIIITPKTQWIVNSINLLFLLIQLSLVADISRMMMKVSLDNDSVSLLRSTAAMMAVLILIFWLQFGLLIGRVPFQNPTSYVYFYYFIDGLECGLVCLVLFFFNKWVPILLHIRSSLIVGIEETHTKMSNANASEVLLTGKGDRGIVTIDSIFMTSESGKWKNSQEEGTKDVVYSNVVQPERLKKTFELYKRLNIIPSDRPTVVEGEEFYDCQFQNPFNSGHSNNKIQSNQILSSTSSNMKTKVLNEGIILKSEKINEQSQKKNTVEQCQKKNAVEQCQKKNAFYSSKYLILDSKENDIPKYLETRPSVSSVSGKESLKDETKSLNKDFSSTLDSLMSDELVRRWLLDNSENMQKNKQNKRQNHRESCKLSNDINLDMKISIQPPQEVVNTGRESQQKENQPTASGSIVSTITSAVSGAFLGKTKDGRKNSVKEKNDTSVQPEMITAVRNDYKKCLINPEKNPEASNSEKNQPAESNDVKSELNTLKPIILELKPASDFLPGPNNNDALMNKKQAENLNSESQKENLGTSESRPSQPLNASELDTKSATLELSKKELSTQLDETHTLKPGKGPKSPEVGSKENSIEMDAPVFVESLNQCLTYSDLLEFRSQHEKQNFDQPSSKSKNLISFSDMFTSTINSMINATGGLFFPRSFPDSDKCNKFENLKINENNPITGKEQNAEQFEGISKPKDKDEQNDFTNHSSDFGNGQDAKQFEDISKLKDKNEQNEFTKHSSDFGIDQDSEQFEDIPKPKYKNEENDFINNPSNYETENEIFQKPQNLVSNRENLGSLEIPSAINADKTENTVSGDVLKKTEHDLKSDSKISVLANADEINDFSPSAADEENSKKINKQVPPEDSEQIEFQPLDKLNTDKLTSKCQIIHSPKIEKMELQPSKLEREENSTKYYDSFKSEKSFQVLHNSKLSELDLPLKTKIRKPQPEQSQRKNLGTAILRSTENETDGSDKSSDSEFSVENRKDSNSSCGSFSTDHYYSQLMIIQDKFHNPSSSISDKKNKTIIKSSFYKS